MSWTPHLERTRHSDVDIGAAAGGINDVLGTRQLWNSKESLQRSKWIAVSYSSMKAHLFVWVYHWNVKAFRLTEKSNTEEDESQDVHLNLRLLSCKYSKGPFIQLRRRSVPERTSLRAAWNAKITLSSLFYSGQWVIASLHSCWCTRQSDSSHRQLWGIFFCFSPLSNHEPTIYA